MAIQNIPENIMKKLIALSLVALFSATIALASPSNEADQKWLNVVEKKIVAGETTISTPSETRVNLLKEWAVQKTYSVEVVKTEAGFRVELSKQLAKN